MHTPKHPKILLVEDDEVDILLFQRHAARHDLGAEVKIVQDAREALSYLSDIKARDGAPPVVMITDLNMPGMNGHELIDDIRNTPHLRNMIIFVISTSDLPTDIARAYDNHIAGYIVKDTSGAATENCVRMLRHYCDSVIVNGA